MMALLTKLRKKVSVLLSDCTRRQRFVALAIGLVVGCLAGLFFWNFQERSWLRYIDNLIQHSWMERNFSQNTLDSRFASSTADYLNKMVAEKLVLIVVDDSSLRSGITWPVKRSTYLTLVKKLEKAGAKTICFDIIFSGPGQDAHDDELLKQAVKRPSVVFPYGLNANELDLVKTKVYPPLLEGWSSKEIAERSGFSLDVPDSIDKRVRLAVFKIAPQEGGQGGVHYSLNVVALAHFLGLTPEQVIENNASQLSTVDLAIAGSPYLFTATVGRIAFFGSDIVATQEAEEAPLPGGIYKEGEIQEISNEAARSDSVIPSLSDFIQVIPIQDILQTPDAELPGFFGVTQDPQTGQEKPNQVMCVLGVNVPGGHDLKQSDIGIISGVGIHTNIIWNLIEHNFLRDTSFSESLALILGMAVISAAIAAIFEVRLASILQIAVLAGYWMYGYRLFYHNYWTSGGLVLPVFMPWIASCAGFAAVVVYNYLGQRRAKDKFAAILQEVAPIPNLDALLSKKGLEIGSKEQILTILFSDIRGYTDLSEGLDPVSITEMLNTYHGAMGEIFARYGGVIFDYQGDAQMVVFGLVPESQPNHAAAACKAGAGMVLRLEALRQEWLEQGRPVFESGIGICTGPVAIGILGSSQRKQYAAIGDPTNTAARMQGKSKELNCPVLITESTFYAAGEEIIANYLETVSVKGKKEPLKVYGVDCKRMQEEKGVKA